MRVNTSRSGLKKRIEQRHLMPRLAQHRRQRRPRTTAVIKAPGRGRESLQQRHSETRQKLPVTGLAGFVAMQTIVRKLAVPIRKLRRIEKGRLTGFTTPVIALAQGEKKAGGFVPRKPDSASKHGLEAVDGVPPRT